MRRKTASNLFFIKWIIDSSIEFFRDHPIWFNEKLKLGNMISIRQIKINRLQNELSN